MNTENLEGYRISPQQKRVYMQQGPNAAVAGIYTLSGTLDKQRLTEALEFLSERHEIMRTTFPSLPGMAFPVQVIGEELAMDYAEVSGDPEQILAQAPPFDHAAGPALWCRLIALSAEEHLLLLRLPALSADRASLAVFVEELLGAYSGRLQEEADATESENADDEEEEEEDDGPIQYADFAEWQFELLDEDETQYWREHEALTPAEPLFFKNEGSGSGEASISLDMTDIQAFCEKYALSPRAVFLATWWLLLNRLGEQTPTLGVYFDMRHIDALDGAFGLFAKSLPLGLDVVPSDRGIDLIQRAAQRLEEVEEQAAYFDWELMPEGAAHFDYTFTFQADDEPLEEAGLKVALKQAIAPYESAGLDLIVNMGASAQLVLQFGKNDYTQNRMERLLDSYVHLLHIICTRDDVNPSQVSLVAETEYEQLIRTWNDTAMQTSGPTTLHGLFEVSAKQNPERIAVRFEGRSLSFAELDHRAARVAGALLAKGVKPGQLVPLYLPRSIDGIVGMLGIWKAGAAYMPVDPAQPEGRVKLMLANANASSIVSDSRYAEHFNVDTVCLDDLPEGSGLPITMYGDLPAYAIYTSGSTGEPKGVVVHHAAAVNLAHALVARLYEDLAPGSIVSMNAPLVFDASVKQLVLMLMGHTLTIVPDEARPDGPALLSWIEAERPDVLDLTPSQAKLLLFAGWADRSDLLPLRVLLGGEALDPTTWSQLCSLGEDRFVNVYGPTECTDVASVAILDRDSAPHVGRPLANVHLYVLDAFGNPVPTGQPGELCIGGVGVSRAYHGKPGQSAARFVPDRFSGQQGARLYRTGDLVRYGSDGRVLFLGRIDRQVKVRGFRIELGEIEAVIAGHPGVRNSAVTLREDQPGDPRLVAYAVANDKGSIEVRGQRRHELPNGMAVFQQNANETDHLYEEIWHKKAYSYFGIDLPAGATVLDVGANIGMFSMFLMAHYSDVKIFAFEPLAPIFETLVGNMSLYGDDRVTCLQFGCSSSDQTVPFTYYPRYSMMSSASRYARPKDEVVVIKRFLEREAAKGSSEAAELLANADDLLTGRFEGQEIDCRLRPLHQVIREQNIGHIDLLKIDVQRAELDVLLGLSEENWASIDQIVMEVHAAQGEASEGRDTELVALLEKHGFQVLIEQDELLLGTDRYNLYARRAGLTERMTVADDLSVSPEFCDRALVVTPLHLREYVRRHLPDYMVPTAVQLLDVMPLTRNGKVDYAALPVPDQMDAQSQGPRALAETPIQELLQGIWGDLLGIRNLGVDESFFELGGHSLLATQLMSRLRETFAVKLSLRDFFDGPSIRHLAQVVEKAMQGPGFGNEVIEPVDRTTDLPLSFAQQRMWFLHRLEPSSTAYHMPAAVMLRGKLNESALQQALDELVSRHEVLRTTFAEQGNAPVQIIHPPETIAIERTSLSEDAVEEWLVTRSQQTFCLETGPLFRVHLARLAEDHHVLLFNAHHIIGDGWSMGILVEEFALLYDAAVLDKDAGLEPHAIQYADFAVWQRRHLAGESLDHLMDYWRKQLGDAEPLALALDFPRPERPEHRGASYQWRFDTAQLEGLTQLGRETHTTLFMTLLAAFEVVLARQSGFGDVSIGTPIANRNHGGSERMPGMFVNTLVMRTQVDQRASFTDHLARVRDTALSAYAHQDMPFEYMVDALGVTRELNRHPLFQVMFTLQQAEASEETKLQGLNLEPLDLPGVTAKFDISLTCSLEADGIAAVLEYDRDLFLPESIARMKDQLVRLIDAVIADPAIRLGQIDLMGDATREQLLALSCGPHTEIGHRSLHRWFEATATQHADKLALLDGDVSLTYAALDERAEQLAARLAGLGIGPGHFVGLYAERSAELFIATIAIAKSGAAYVPLDPANPPERLAYIIEDAGLKTVLAQDTLPTLPEGLQSLLLDGHGGLREDLPAAASKPVHDGALPAYVIYTSGSTGKPKGVLVPHSGVCNLLAWHHRTIGVKAGGRTAQTAGPAFDATVLEFWPYITAASQMHIVPETIRANPEALRDFLLDQAIDTLFVPTPLGELLMSLPWPEGCSLHTLLVGGDKLHSYPADDLPFRVINNYGPTENSVVSTSAEVKPGNKGAPHIGTALDNQAAYVLDRDLHLVAPGSVGELCCAGSGLAYGYVNRPGQTAAVFVPNPFSQEPGARLYRTGDRVCRREGAALHFLGRLDKQVKLRGFRIEPGEIEAALANHPAVALAAVVIRDESLHAYVTLQDSIDADTLRESLRGKLPAYMVPSSVTVLDQLPHNTSGKLDRRLLATSEVYAPTQTEATPPRNETEQKIASIWQTVLKRESVGVFDDFFASGGHSLTATQVVSRLRDAFGVDVPLRELFAAPTVAGLAAYVALHADDQVHLPAIEKYPESDTYPLSLMQQRLWFLFQLEGSNAVYNMPLALRLEGELVPEALERALVTLRERHAALRTRIEQNEDGALQRVLPATGWSLSRTDLSMLAPELARVKADELTERDAVAPFELDGGPLFRAHLLRLSDREHRLLLNVHHIISDGWSIELLVRETTALYQAYSKGEANPLAEAALHYGDFARWQHEHLTGAVLDGQLAYWKHRLGGYLAPLELPTDYARPKHHGFSGGRFDRELPAALSGSLKQLALTRGATLYQVLLATFKVLLARYSGQKDILVGSPVAGRHHGGTEDLFGFFINTLVLRTSLEDGPSFDQLLGRVREHTVGAYDHQDVPFEKLVEVLKPERDLSRNPIFQVFFNMLNVPEDDIELGELEVHVQANPDMGSKFDLTLYAHEHGDVIQLQFLYNRELFEEARIAGWAASFERLLQCFATKPECPVFEAALASPEGARLPDPSRPLVATDHESIPAAFLRRALAEPGAVALQGEETWLYSDLLLISNQIANCLRYHGGGLRQVVGILGWREPVTVATMLAVMRAGASFVMLDPAYPGAQLVERLEQAGAKYLVIAGKGIIPSGLFEWGEANFLLVLDSYLKDYETQLERWIDTLNELKFTADSPAYVAFTSGTSGKARGIRGNHGALSHFLAWHTYSFQLEEGDRFAMLSGLAHDPLLRDAFTPLVLGAALYIPPSITEAHVLLDWLIQQEITVVHWTPSLAEMVLGAAEATGRELPALRRAFFGGEPLTGRLVARLHACAEQVEVVNFYGATETPQAMGHCHVPRDFPADDRLVPIGYPIEGVQLLVVNDAGKRAEVGEPGEILVRTPYLAVGYLDETETKAAFPANPLVETPAPGDRVYKTGDMGTYLPDGQVTFIGRRDGQLKLRGFRVEPAEIESLLLSREEILGAAVVLRRMGQADALVAYVTTKSGSSPNLGAFRNYLAGHLPTYAVPAAIVPVDAFPLTPNGKLDRRSLAHSAAYAPTDTSWQESLPMDPEQEIIASIWSEILGQDRIGLEANFFELGGHSLLGTRVMTRLAEAFGVNLPLRALFEAPTVAGLARKLDTARREADNASLPPMIAKDHGMRLPLSFAQQRLWFLDRLEGTGPGYNLPSALRLKGPLNTTALDWALHQLLLRHDNLRLRFAVEDGMPYGCLNEVPRHPLIQLELEDEPTALAFVAEDARATFDLSTGPLLRCHLLRLDEQDHILTLNMHHIISDGWSMGLLVRELSAFYRAAANASPAPLDPLPLQYADYAAWQRAWLTGPALERHLGWWREQLAGIPTVIQLPTVKPRSQVKTISGASYHFTLNAELTRGLHALAREAHATNFMTLLAGFQVLLARYSGQDDVVVGSPIANRTRAEVEPLIGFFVNTLALRGRMLDEDERVLDFAGLLQQVRETTLGAYAHQDLPFEKLVEELQPDRNLGHSPLFQVMFVYQNTPQHDLDVDDLHMSDLSIDTESALFDIMLVVQEHGGELIGRWNYNRDLIARETIEAMAGCFELLLREAVRHPETPCNRLQMVGEAERARLLAWNDRAQPMPHETVLPLFAATLAATPDAVALEGYDSQGRWQEISYRQLDSDANRMANLMLAHGIRPDMAVAICMPRLVHMPIAVLAVLKLGACYLPLDPAYPHDRLNLMLADSRAPLLLTSDGVLSDRIREDWSGTIVDWHTAPVAEYAADDPGVEVYGEHPAYLVYTSGSTGKPKGVCLPHFPLYNLIANDAVKDAGRTLQYSSLSFDVSSHEMWTAWAFGGTLIMIDEDSRRDPVLLCRYLREQRVQSLFMPYAALQLLSTAIEREAPPEHLRYIFTAGEQLQITPAITAFFERVTSCSLYNYYGPSESHIITTYLVDGPVREWSLLPPIGKPVPNARCYVLDQNLRLIPAGSPGELFLAGSMLARCYLGQPAKTAERFLPDPYSSVPGARIYKSGDLSRYAADGNIEFMGRVDHQVKFRGYRVEPGEIEHNLMNHAAVSEAVVLVQEHGEHKVLAGYWVADADAENLPDAEALQRWLARSLPEYMVPGALIRMERMPLTPSGKIDRKALPKPESVIAKRGYVAPRTGTEEMLAGIWAQLLGGARISADASFFELGGHSLTATRLLSRIHASFDVEPHLRDIFEQPVLRDLAARIDELRGQQPESLARPAIVAQPRKEITHLPLSFGQQRLWFLDQMEGPSATYNMSFALRLEGELDRSDLERALDALVARHEVFRTSFVTVDDTPMQRIVASVEIECHYEDLSDREDRHKLCAELIEERVAEAFDLGSAPLLRVALIRLGEREYVLGAVMHHIISDGWSMDVLTREIGTLYTAFARNEQNPLLAPALQYGDYAVWQRQWLSGDELARQTGYWKARLADLPPLLELPTDRPRPGQANAAHAGVVRHSLSQTLTAALEARAKAANTTEFTVLLAAFSALLGRLSGSDDIAVGTPVANRQQAELEGMIGFFVNNLVLRTRLSDHPDFDTLLGRVRDGVLDAYAHQEIPFEKLVEELRPERATDHAPLFQVMFLMEGGQEEQLVLEGMKLTQWEQSSPTAKFDLTLTMGKNDGAFEAVFIYSSDLFDEATVARFADWFAHLLQGVVDHPEQPVTRLPLPSDDPAQLIGPETDSAVLVPATFVARAELEPESVALVMDGQSLSYGELAARAGQLAAALAEAGIGRESIVGLALPRGRDMFVAQLAVWQAGAAFVPLDQALPAERLAYICDDCQPALILCLGEGFTAPNGYATLDIGGITESAGEVTLEILPEQLAYIIYTSGSTGRPKGVAVSHRALADHLASATATYALKGEDRVLHFASFNFDPSLEQAWSTLTCGATLVARGEQLPTAAELLALIDSAQISVLNLPPAMWRQLVDQPGDALSSVRLVLVGGDVMDPSAAERHLASPLGNGRLVNVYGPTETTVTATYQTYTSATVAVPIGTPLPGRRATVVDSLGQTVPAGIAGELLLGGHGLARGYVGRPAETALRFVPDANAQEPGARVYRTGDRVRLHEGTLHFKGRLDKQIKLRGFRIECGEIEAVLAAHPLVGDCAVVVETPNGNQRLAAHFTVAGTAPELGELRAWLAERLPDYMVPTAFAQHEQLPLNHAGKIDRAALPLASLVSGEERSLAGADQPLEQMLAGLWQELLGLESVALTDNFFEIGGHSLLATRLVARISSVCGVAISLRDVFAQPTIPALAARIRAALQGEAEALPAPVRLSREKPLPLSFAQERLWFTYQLDKQMTNFNMSFPFRIGGTLDVEALSQAFNKVIEHQESLRTRFVTIGEEAFQVIDAVPEQPLQLLNLTDLPEVERLTRAQALVSDQRDTPFNLEAAAPFKVYLMKLGEADHVLHICLHHIIFDGWSAELLIGELTRSYEAIRAGDSIELPELPIQYADYAAWQQRLMRGERLERQLDFWRRSLAGPPEKLKLPNDKPYSEQPSPEGLFHGFAIPDGQLEAAQALSRKEGVTMFMLMLSAVQTLLHRYSGQTDMVLGSNVAGRNGAHTEHLMGFFVNYLVLRTDLGGNPSFRELLQRVRETTLASYVNQDVSFDRLVAELQPERVAGNMPFFQAVVAYQNIPEAEEKALSLDFEPLSGGGDDVNFDLILRLREAPGRLSAQLSARAELFHAPTLERLGRELIFILEQALADPDKPLADFALQSEQDRFDRARDMREKGSARLSRFKKAKPKAVRVKK